MKADGVINARAANLRPPHRADGIRVPDPIVLPNPATLFARRAARLEFLAESHPMAGWLRFIASVSRAQNAAAEQLSTPVAPNDEQTAQAVAATTPPLSLAAHRLQPLWQDMLGLVLRHIDDLSLPTASRGLLAALSGVDDDDALDAMAGRCLGSDISADETAHSVFVTAALQVYFATTAATLDVSKLRLLEQRGLCPVCGHAPASSVVTALGRAPGTRFLHCSLCATAWNYTRAVCTTCGGARSLSLREIEGGNGAVKAETCDDCQKYIKVLYEAKDPKIEPAADDLATLGLDLLVGEAGWSRPPPMIVPGLL
jgi:FdhE protein